jgi:ribosome-associated protein
MIEEQETDDAKPSKSQRKRDMDELKHLADRLTEIPNSQLDRVPYEEIKNAVRIAQKITKGNARKRQIGYIAKQLANIDLDPIMAIIDRLDASSAAHVRKFHQLESWREQLLEGNKLTMQEIIARYPGLDRQHLRQLVRNAVSEKETGDAMIHFRKVFQYLKQLANETID